MTDAEYDRLFQELVSLERQHPEIADPNSPTVRVGRAETASSFAKVQHARPMLSLDNAFSAEEVLAFFGGQAALDLVAEWKIDGLSLSLTYDHGQLIKAVTRGDGTIGDDVTENARTITTIPLRLPHDLSIEVRGEAYMSKETFKRLNEERAAEGEDPFANPRNAASGTLKQRDSRVVAARGLGFIAYQVFGSEHPTHVDSLEFLKQEGFVTPRYLTSAFPVKVLIDDFAVKRALGTVPFDVDGVVFKVNSKAAQRELGLGTRSPKWAVAYKFPPEQKVTRLNAIIVQVGRTGTLTPVAELEPVNVGGVVVRRASLCNQDEIERLGINVGDEVIISRMGDVIPKVTGLSHKHVSGHWKMPVTCPCCSTEVKRDEGMVACYCLNQDCPDRLLERMKHALAKGALDWDGMGEAAIKDMLAHNIVRSLSDMLALDDESIHHMFKPAMQRKFKQEREKAKAAPLWRKLCAFGIEGVGRTASKELCVRFKSLVEMFADLESASVIKEIIGPVATQSFIDFVDVNMDEIVRLSELGYKLEDDRSQAGPLSGKTFVITGTMMSGQRDEVQRKIEAAGGTCKDSVSKKVTFLVKGDGAGRNKTAAAEKHGIKIISEDDLYRMLGQEMTICEATTQELEY